MRFTRSPATSAARISRCRSSDCRRSPAVRSCASDCRRRRSRSKKSARFLVGAAERARAGADPGCAIVDSGHARARDLALELPPAPLEAVMSGEVWTPGLRPSRRARARASHDARVRQHAAAGRARGAAFVRADRRRTCRRASRQPRRKRTATGRRATAEARRAQGTRGDRLARARHRHRRCGSRVPDRLDALHQRVPAARRPRRPLGGTESRKAGCFRCPATNSWNAPRCSMRCAAANSIISRCRRARSTSSRNRSTAEVVRAGMAGGCVVRSRAPRVLLPRPRARGVR